MTDKFKKMSQELNKLCTLTNKVKTRKQARELSLKKWISIRKMSLIFWEEFNTRCGFCGLSEHIDGGNAKEGVRPRGRCQCCGVKTICVQMLETAQSLEEETMTLINGLISHFENMKVADD